VVRELLVGGVETELGWGRGHGTYSVFVCSIFWAWSYGWSTWVAVVVVMMDCCCGEW